MRALVIANAGDDDAGYVGERLVQRGYTLEVRYRDRPGLPENLDGYDLVVSLGSDWSTYWEHVSDEVEREAALVREASVRDLPVLGICYGSQLMAQALGGSVQRAARTEIGWFTLETDDVELASEGPWFEFHVDAFTPPPGARVFARTDAGPQAFQLGRLVGWQFHPEVSPEIVRRWGADSRDQAAEAGVDLEAVYRETDGLAEEARRRAHRLVDAFLDRVVAGSSVGQGSIVSAIES